MFGVVRELGLTKDHLALVGAIAVEWSAIEFKLQSLLSTAIGKDYALGLSATSNMGYKSIVATLRTLAGSAKASIPTFNSQIVALLDEAERLQLLRNAVVHASWDSVNTHGGMNAQVARFKGKLKNYVEIWSREQLEQIAADCGELLSALYEFMQVHELQEEIDKFQSRQASLGTPNVRQPAQVQPRSPKSEAVMLQLLASRQ
jgi:hypothetical protein